MTHIDRRASTNGKARTPKAPPTANPVTWGQWMAPDHRHRPVTRGELMAYTEEALRAMRWQDRQNALLRRLWRHARAWWAYLTTPKGAK